MYVYGVYGIMFWLCIKLGNKNWLKNVCKVGRWREKVDIFEL